MFRFAGAGADASAERRRGSIRGEWHGRSHGRGVESAGGRGEVQVAGSFGCPLGENPPPQFGKHLVKRLTYRGKVATFRAMKSTELVRVLITEGRH